jgi:hypothetical protein
MISTGSRCIVSLQSRTKPTSYRALKSGIELFDYELPHLSDGETKKGRSLSCLFVESGSPRVFLQRNLCLGVLTFFFWQNDSPDLVEALHSINEEDAIEVVYLVLKGAGQ